MEIEKFLDVIDNTPLVSIDLIVEREDHKILLGLRCNKPAQGFWFVPGGRIRKNESLEMAMKRISSIELGFEINISEATLLGAYDHIYDDNFHSQAGINTHYVVLGYKVPIDSGSPITIDEQHSEVRWWSKDELLVSSLVHQNTKNYFDIV